MSKKAISIATYDFSTFYTNIQHNRETRILFMRQELQTKVSNNNLPRRHQLNVSQYVLNILKY